jgi:hypothetical protein
MPVMRIELTDEENRQIMSAKSGELKTAYAKRVLMEAVKRDNNKKDKKK